MIRKPEYGVAFDVRPPRDYFPRMSMTADQTEQPIKSLQDTEKQRLVEIMADLVQPDPEIDRIWATKLENPETS